MFTKILKIIKLIYTSKFSFSIPKKKVIFFDYEGFLRFKSSYDYILEKDDYFVLKTRLNHINKIYISCTLVCNFLKNLIIIKNLKISYLVSLILEINPKIVVTNIDNSTDFSLVARRLFKKIKFLAIQNAARYQFDEPFYDANIKKKYFIPELACFGDYEKSLYKRHKIEVKNFFVIGSLTLSDYQKKKKKSFIDKKYDVCLILEESTGWNNLYSGFEESLGKIAQFTVKFCKEKKLNLIIAGKRQNEKLLEKEKIFYSKYIDQDFKILPNSNYSSYKAIENSEVTIGMMSTILREGMALNKKILSCNFTGCSAWDFPIKGICFLNDNNFEKFSIRLEKLLKLSINEYKQSLSFPTSYIMAHEKHKLADQKIKERIQSIIE